jgi:hypothetical protein
MKEKLIWKLRPAVDKKILMLLAGIMWCGVGATLMRYSVFWLMATELKTRLIFGTIGLIASLPIYYYGFLKLAQKNLSRLLPMKEKKCLFSFITWKSYLIVPVMVSLGIFLRHSPIQKQYLSVIYTGIGMGLFLSGAQYFRFLFLLIFSSETNQPL